MDKNTEMKDEKELKIIEKLKTLIEKEPEDLNLNVDVTNLSHREKPA